jgi:hypothetical protein
MSVKSSALGVSPLLGGSGGNGFTSPRGELPTDPDLLRGVAAESLCPRGVASAGKCRLLSADLR